MVDQVPAPTPRFARVLRAAVLAVLAALLLSPAALAGRGHKHIAPDKRTNGLGKSCQSDSGCSHSQQRCLKEQDANGKPLKVGFCTLPCLAIDAGITQVVPGQPIEPTPENMKEARKPPPPRCPPHFQCRSAGSGVPIDLCIKE
jgi:hypothetical protein